MIYHQDDVIGRMTESQRVGDSLNSVLFFNFRDRIRTQRALNAYV